MRVDQQPSGSSNPLHPQLDVELALKAAGLGVWAIDPTTKLVQWDEPCRKLFGQDHPDQLPYEQFLQSIHPLDRPRVDEAIQRAMAPPASGPFEVTLTFRTLGADDGRLRWVRFMGRSYLTPAGQVYRLAGLAQEITNEIETQPIGARQEPYRSIFQSMNEAYYLVEVLAEADQIPVDYRIEEANPAFEQLTGLRDAVGKTMHELGLTLDVSWLETYGAVALTGGAHRFGGPVAGLANRWFEGYAFRLGDAPSRLVAVRLRDSTGRKRREANRAFLAQLTDEFTRRLSAEAIMQTVGAKIGQYLNVASVNFMDIDESQEKELTVSYFWGQPGMPILLGKYHIRDFLTEEFERASRAGETYVINDTQTDPRTDAAAYASLEIGAYVNIPFHYQSRWTNIMAITDTQPRVWRADELELFGELANRIFPWLQRARAQEALRQSEERLQLAISGAHLFTWEVNAQTRELLTSPNFREVLGFELASDAGQNFLHIHPDDYEWVTGIIEQALRGAQKLRIEHRILNPQTGETIWVQVHGQLVPGDATSPGRLIGITQNITGHKLAELAVQESRTRLQKAIQIGTVGVLFFDNEGRFLEANDAFLTMTGYTREQFETQGLAIQDITLPEWLPRARQALDELKTIGRATPYEKEFKRPDGSHWWGLNAGTKLRTNEHVEFIVDVSSRKQAEDSLRQADRRKDEFLAMLTHELRNPMATIRSGLQILTVTATEEMTRSTVEMMDRQTDHLVHMLDDLLDVSRISQGKINLKTERVNLVDLVGQAIQNLQPLFDQQGKTLSSDLPSVPLEVAGDATRLTQVVTNLLTNGLRYTGDQGRVWLEVAQQNEPDGRTQATIQVRDNGIGLAADQLSSIFELFVQVDNSTARAKGGLGLGLTLVSRLVDLHGGRVEAQSEGLGKGSTFTVYLPALPVVAQGTTKPTTGPLGIASGLRVLVIDDNADAATTLGMLLKLKGYEVYTRNSGRAGIEAAEKLQPGAILLDIGMPELDGYETCRLIRQQSWGRDLVVIALTGYGQMEDRQRTKKAGFNGHLVKPVDLEELMKLLMDLLDKQSTSH